MYCAVDHVGRVGDAQLELTPPGGGAGGAPLGATARGGLASFLSFVRRAGRRRDAGRPGPPADPGASDRVHDRPEESGAGGGVGGRLSVGAGQRFRPGGRPGHDHGGRAAALAALQSAHPTAAGVPPQHVQALRGAVEEVTATHSTVRRRLRAGQRVVIDLDQTAISANGRTYERTARGHLKKRGDRGYQATAAFAGDTGGGDDEVLAVFLDPGNAHATWRFADLLAALERVLGPLERWRGLVLRFDCQYATADDLARCCSSAASTSSGGSTPTAPPRPGRVSTAWA